MKDLPPPEANFARLFNAPIRKATAQVALLSFALALVAPCHSPAQEPKRPAGSVQLSFLPPPLEKATYSLGIFDTKTNKLVRHLQEAALERDFTVGLNGLITTWDGKDDSGKPVPPGRYAARGYAVGSLKVTGEEIQGNDWVSEDENLRFAHVAAIELLPDNAGVAVLAHGADGPLTVARFAPNGKLLWSKPINGPSPSEKPWLQADAANLSVFFARPSDGKDAVAVETYRIEDGTVSKQRVILSVKASERPALPPGAVEVVPPPAAEFSPAISGPELSVRSGISAQPVSPEHKPTFSVSDPWTQTSPGKDGTSWTAAGLSGLVQTAHDGTLLRKLEVTPGAPLPVAVSASATGDQLYLLEEKPGWQRVRGLSWVETKEENGKPVSTWQTFFERSIHAPDPAVVPASATPVEISLAENSLSPGKPAKLRLAAAFDSKGSYLATESGLHLRRISERPNLLSVRVARGKTSGGLSFFQSDGAATDEFSIAGARNIMEFDAGEFEMTATGEKPADSKTAEPPDL